MSFEGQNQTEVLEQNNQQEGEQLVTPEEMAAELKTMNEAVKEGNEMIEQEKEIEPENQELSPENIEARKESDDERIRELKEDLRTTDQNGGNRNGGNIEFQSIPAGSSKEKSGGGMTHESKTEFKICEVCHGSGRKWFIFNCGVCHGTGRVKSAEISKTKFS